MTDNNEMLALDRVTGLVHQYNGTKPGGIGSEDMGFGVGVIPCDCEGDHAELFEEDLVSDNVVVVDERHLEQGIWEPAPCLGGEDGE